MCEIQSRNSPYIEGIEGNLFENNRLAKNTSIEQLLLLVAL
jgi:hypothetical protein